MEGDDTSGVNCTDVPCKTIERAFEVAHDLLQDMIDNSASFVTNLKVNIPMKLVQSKTKFLFIYK